MTSSLAAWSSSSAVSSSRRAGLHTGEIELRDGDIGGIAVHIFARVMAAAEPGQILTSRTVHDLVVGSDIALDDLGDAPTEGRRRQLATVRGQTVTASRPGRRAAPARVEGR